MSTENTGISKYTAAFGLSLAITSVINALIVVAKEQSKAVMAGMAKFTGHHWVTHSAIILILFAGLGWMFAHAKGGQGISMTVNRLIGTVLSGVVLGGLIIVGFYLIGD
jgi:hypothetical protein